MISEKDVETERFAFDLAVEFGINIAQQSGKPLIGYELYKYVIDEVIKRDGEKSVEAMRRYAKLWGNTYGCARKENMRGKK